MALKNINLAPITNENVSHETSEIESQPSEGISEAVVDETSEAEMPEPEPQTTDKPIASAPTIQEPDQREKELDELISKLREVNRHWKVEDARKKGVPMKALLHVATLWLSDDMDDWTAATDTIYSFTSPYGLKQLQYPNKAEVFVPDFNKRLKGRDNP